MSGAEKLELTAEDGVEEILFVHDPDKPPVAVILILPAMGVAARYYRTLARTFAEDGYAVARAEYRGHGKSPYRAGRSFDYGYRDLVEVSIPTWADAARERWPNCPLFLLGHSLGGHLALLHASLPSSKIDGMMLVASGSVHYRAWTDSLGGCAKALFGTQFIALFSQVLGYWPGEKFGFAGREARTLTRDWAHYARAGSWRLAGSSRDWDAALARIEVPLLAVSLDFDELAPRRPVDELVASLSSAEITRVHLEESDAAPQVLTHFRWALDPAAVVERLQAWLKSHQVSSSDDIHPIPKGDPL